MCMYCNGNEMTDSMTTHVVSYGDCLIIIKNVPCLECSRCGEKYYSDEVAVQLDKIVSSAKKMTQEISVIDYRRAA